MSPQFSSHSFKNRALTVVTLTLLSYAPLTALAQCNAENETWNHFSSTATKDKLSITINGASCDNLTQKIRIHNAENKLLYSHVSEFKDGSREQVSLEFIQFIVQFSLHENFLGLTHELPDWNTLTNQSIYQQQMYVSNDRYLSLIKRGWPMFSHQSNKDQFLTITYDRTHKKIIKILNGNMKW